MDEMVNLLLLLLVLLFAWSRYKLYTAHKYRYRLMALHDELRERVAAGTLRKTWYTTHLIQAVARQTQTLGSVNLWGVILLGLRYRNAAELRKQNEQLNRAAENDKAFAEVYHEYGNLLLGFYLRKHLLTLLLLSITSIPFVGTALLANRYVRELTDRVRGMVTELTRLPEPGLPSMA